MGNIVILLCVFNSTANPVYNIAYILNYRCHILIHFFRNLQNIETTTADNMNNNKTLEMAQEAVKKFTYIRFTFFDMNGVPRGKVLPAKAALRLLESGISCAIGNFS